MIISPKYEDLQYNAILLNHLTRLQIAYLLDQSKQTYCRTIQKLTCNNNTQYTKAFPSRPAHDLNQVAIKKPSQEHAKIMKLHAK